MSRRILYVANTGFALYHFRLPIMKHLLDKGWSVMAAANDEADFQAKFAESGIKFINVSIDHKGKNPIRDMALVAKLKALYVAESPDIIHHFTIKPVIFGSLAAKIAHVPAIVNTITGMGYSFKQGGFLKWLTLWLYRLALAGGPQVIFQNHDDYRFFIRNGIVKQANGRVILGSGVDTEKIRSVESRRCNENLRFLMVSRMLWSKGVGDYVSAAEKIKTQFPETVFRMVGGASGGGAKGNPESVPDRWLQDVNSRGAVQWVGRVPFEEVMAFLDEADVFVAPSYYPEGVPRSLIEAAAKGKPIITTDTPGCREVVVDGVNGFLVSPRRPDMLVDSFSNFILNPGLVREMGAQSRNRAVDLFDEKKILNQTIRLYNEADLFYTINMPSTIISS